MSRIGNAMKQNAFDDLNDAQRAAVEHGDTPLLVIATFGVCFASFEIVRRVAWLRPLFGLAMRERSPRPSAAGAMQTAGQP